ncbi:MAG: dTMP kinase [Kosmotoga sp.]|nr:MAG: dTMP kinase [Kosmotoga sp.]
MFISFEGIDGSGKSTQFRLFKKYLERENEDFVVIREPGSTRAGEDIREILLHKDYNLCPESELLLFLASRAQIVREIIVPSLQKGKVVIADRFLDSSLAYQAYGRGLPVELVKSINSFVVDECLPDLTFLIDISARKAIKRKQKNTRNDKIEIEGKEFFEKVRKGYLKIAEENRNRVYIFDGEKSPNTLHEEIVRIFRKQKGGFV